jgi:hypothetical protein
VECCDVVVLLSPVVFAPDVKHEHTGNEKERHYQNWNWASESEKENGAGVIVDKVKFENYTL